MGELIDVFINMFFKFPANNSDANANGNSIAPIENSRSPVNQTAHTSDGEENEGLIFIKYIFESYTFCYLNFVFIINCIVDGTTFQD